MREENNLNAFEKTIQVISVVIIVISILGLPFYFVLDKRRKRIHEENKAKSEENKPDDDNENKE
jgi:Tfp pilus assembly protein PilO